MVRLLMMKKNNLLLLVLSKKNIAFWATLMLLITMLTTLVVSAFVVDAHQKRLVNYKGNVYGFFYSVVYQDSADISVEPEIDLPKIEAQNFYFDDDISIAVGYYSNNAKDLFYRGNVSYTLSEKKRDGASFCLLSESASQKLDKKKDDVIFIRDKKYIVEHIVPDIGYLWIRGEKEEISEMFVPGIWVSSSDFNLLSDLQNKYRILLLDYKRIKTENMSTLSGNIYQNTPITRDENLYIYKIPRGFFTIQQICMFVILTFLLIEYRRYSKDRYSIYSDLGLDDNEVTWIMRKEIILMVVSAFIATFVIGAVICCLLLIAFYQDINLFNFFEFLVITCRILSPFFVMFAFSIVLVEFPKNSFKQRANLRARVKNFMEHNALILGKLNLALYFVLLLTLSLTGAFVKSTTNYLSECAFEIELLGQIPKNYDFELYFIPRGFPSGQHYYGDKIIENDKEESKVYFNRILHKSELDNLVSEIESIEGVGYVNRYIEQYNAYCVVPEKVLNSRFLSEVLFTFVEIFGKNEFTNKYVKEDEFQMVQTHIFSLPEDMLKTFATEIDIEDDKWKDLLEGRSALLISPSVKVIESKSENGSSHVRWERTTIGDDLLKDEEISNYKNLPVYFPQSPKSILGMVPATKLIEYNAELRRVEVPIAGYSYKNLGWFSVTDYSPTPYRLLVSDKFFSYYNLNYETTRLHIYLSNPSLAEQVSQKLQIMIKNINELQFTDQYYSLKTWHEYKVLEGTLKFIYVLNILCIAVFFAYSIGHSYWLSNENNFAVYRDIGITKMKLYYWMSKPIIITTMLAIFVQMTVSILFYNYVVYAWHQLPFVQKILSQAIPFGIFAFMLLVFLFIRMNRMMHYHKYTE